MALLLLQWSCRQQQLLLFTFRWVVTERSRWSVFKSADKDNGWKFEFVRLSIYLLNFVPCLSVFEKVSLLSTTYRFKNLSIRSTSPKTSDSLIRRASCSTDITCSSRSRFTIDTTVFSLPALGCRIKILKPNLSLLLSHWSTAHHPSPSRVLLSLL